MDPGTGITIAGGLWGTKDLIVKVLGPTADYLGGEIQTWVEKRHENIRRVFAAAERKLPQGQGSGGAVPPRVLKNVLEDASFSDEPIVAEYFGGVLASSKSEDGKDDRGVGIAAMIARLSSGQLRGHYMFYSAVKKLFDGSDIEAGKVSELSKLRIYVPWEVLATGLEIEDSETQGTIVLEALFQLSREGLITTDFLAGSQEDLLGRERIRVQRHGIVFAPSPLGVMLFLWAHGHGSKRPNYFFASDFRADRHVPFDVEECRVVSELREQQ